MDDVFWYGNSEYLNKKDLLFEESSSDADAASTVQAADAITRAQELHERLQPSFLYKYRRDSTRLIIPGDFYSSVFVERKARTKEYRLNFETEDGTVYTCRHKHHEVSKGWTELRKGLNFHSGDVAVFHYVGEYTFKVYIERN